MRDACAVRARSALWTCPKCGRRFVGKNMWHACGNYSVEGFLDGKGVRARELFECFERLIADRNTAADRGLVLELNYLLTVAHKL